MIAGGVALVVAAIAALDGGVGWGGGWWWWGGLFPLLLIGLAAALVWRHLERRRSDGQGLDAGWIAGRLALVVAIAAVSTLAFLASALAAAAGGGAVVAAIVIATGVMLVAAAFRGGARWLILPALLLALPAGIVSAAGVDLDGGIGDREYRPASASDLRDRYQLGIGRLEVDLRDVQFPRGDRPVELDLGVGEAIVFVPENVCVTLDSRVGAGYVQLFDRDSSGVDVDWDIARTATGTAPRLVVKADVGIGALHVVHDEGEVRDGEGRFFDDGSSGDGNTACQAGAEKGGGTSGRGGP
jgi:predicted membrane protein